MSAVCIAAPTTATANDDTPAKIEGVPCEVCVSKQYLQNQRDLVGDLKDRKSELLRKYEAANAVADERANRIDSLEQKNARLTKANARLRANQVSRATWFAVGAGSTAVVVGVVGAVLAF